MALLSLVTVWVPGLFLPAYSDTQPELKKFNAQVVGEPGCPVEMVGAATELELDPFGSPVAARHYIDYRNVGNRPIVAVKFRIGYVGADGKINQPYVNGDDQQQLEPGQTASKKFRGDKVDPHTSAVKIRVLKVKFADGSLWESVKLNETNSQQQQGFAPLSIESPGGDGFGGGQPVPFRDYGQQGFQGFPKSTGSVPLTQTPGQASNGGVYQAVPTSGEYPTRAPAGQYAGGGTPAGAAGPSVGAGHYATAAGGAPDRQPAPSALRPYESPAGSANADFAPFTPPTSAPASAGAPFGTGASAASAAPSSAIPAAAPSRAPSASPYASNSSLPSYTRPSQVTLPAAPTDTEAELNSILGISKKAPSAVAPLAPPSNAAPSAQPATSPAAPGPQSMRPATQGAPQASGSAAPPQQPQLRPTLVPGQPVPQDSAVNAPPGDGDKSLDLR
ncbi:MAG TPA: hypothetical protein V6D22_07530 [Candidatus Obscuribacterales bacterium]